MKYIKSYESIDINNIKKYIIYKPDNSLQLDKDKNKWLFIYLILNINNDYTTLLRVYRYNISEEKLLEEKMSEELFVPIPAFSNRILFTSDNINECIEMLPLISNTNKYNL